LEKGQTSEKELKLLFLGHDKELHNSRELLNTIQEHFSGEGIELTYTEDPNDIAKQSLNNSPGPGPGIKVKAGCFIWHHDDRTWSNPEFQKLLVNGIKWAVNKNAH